MMQVLRRLFQRDEENKKASNSKIVKVFGKKGKGKGNFKSPCGVAVTQSGDIVVADTENHLIQIFSGDGVFKFQFGNKGHEEHSLNFPQCIAMTTDDNIAVTDSVSARVKIFSKEGIIQNVFAKNGEVEFPYGIAISIDNFIIVTDICKHRVVVLFPSGGLSHTFGSYGEKNTQFDHPYFVAVNRSKQIIVSDVGNSSIKLFNFEGRILRTFTSDDFRLPDEQLPSLYGLCCDGEGNTIMLCNNAVYILIKNGRLWEIISAEERVIAPKCIAYSPHGHLIMTQHDYGDVNEVVIYKYNPHDYDSLNMLLFYAITI